MKERENLVWRLSKDTPDFIGKCEGSDDTLNLIHNESNLYSFLLNTRTLFWIISDLITRKIYFIATLFNSEFIHLL